MGWLVTQFCTACHGCIFWNFDGPAISEWNMSKSARAFGIDWRALASSICWPPMLEHAEKLAKQVSFQLPRARLPALPARPPRGPKSWAPPRPLQQLVHAASNAAVGPALMIVQQLPLYKLHGVSFNGECI